MIINRTGRRIFPYVKFTLKGLDPAGLYDIMFDIIPADTNYFKFVDNKWFSLRTLQKYLVKISLIKHKTDIFSVLEIPIPVPTFEAVTAYNNRQVTELKIKSNPYSKAFRYPKSRMKKPSVSLSDKKTNKHQNKKIPTSRMDMFTESFDEIHHIQQPSQSTALQNDRRKPSKYTYLRLFK
ncbi:T-box transcription factor T-A-like [Magallana gigas]|uniref:T-box transcription factor T-A-like n=1 Tax=Magallana gigas TaxID=29159 RepID=UPI003341903D